MEWAWCCLRIDMYTSSARAMMGLAAFLFASIQSSASSCSWQQISESRLKTRATHNEAKDRALHQSQIDKHFQDFSKMGHVNRLRFSLATLTVWWFASAAGPPHPHIVVFVADDLGYNDLGFTNGGKTHTPYINELVKESTLLSNYYQWRLCSPSRASLLSGRYP